MSSASFLILTCPHEWPMRKAAIPGPVGKEISLFFAVKDFWGAIYFNNRFRTALNKDVPFGRITVDSWIRPGAALGICPGLDCYINALFLILLPDN